MNLSVCLNFGYKVLFSSLASNPIPLGLKPLLLLLALGKHQITELDRGNKVFVHKKMEGCLPSDSTL